MLSLSAPSTTAIGFVMILLFDQAKMGKYELKQSNLQDTPQRVKAAPGSTPPS
jgi:hypothetical protein